MTWDSAGDLPMKLVGFGRPSVGFPARVDVKGGNILEDKEDWFEEVC